MTHVLGYTRFGTQGGDWGQAVTVQLAAQFPQSLIGIHLNGAGRALLGQGEPTADEQAW